MILDSKMHESEKRISELLKYYDILKSNDVEIEAEYFRELFETYCSKFKYQRELFIYEDRLHNTKLPLHHETKIV